MAWTFNKPVFRPDSIPTGLVAYWKFNNDATDYTGSYNLGLTGTPAYVVEDYWKSGEYSTDLDGSSMSFTATRNTALDLLDKFSLAGWFKADANNDVLMGKNGTDLEISTDASNQLNFTIKGTTIVAPFSQGKWHHFVATYDQAKVCLFLDGNLISSAVHSTDLTDTSANLTIGSRAGSVFWDGHLKDIAVWSVALTPIQIKSLALGVDLSKYAYRPNNVSTQPTVWWKLNEVSGTRADSIGSLDLTDGNTVLSSGGYIEGVGADFEATASEYLYHAGSANFYLDGDFTIRLRAKFETVASDACFIRAYTDVSNYWILEMSSTSEIKFRGEGGDGAVLHAESWSPTAGVWYDVVVRLVRSTNTFETFIDGVSIGTTIDANTLFDATSAEFAIGRGASVYFDGVIEDVAIWKGYALTDAEIKSLACALPIQRQGIVSYWKGGDLTDSIGTNTLTNNNAVTFTAGQVGNAFTLVAASEQSLSCADSASLDTIDTDCAFLLWAKPTSTAGNQSILSKLEANFAVEGVTTNVRIYADGTSLTNAGYATWTAGAWNHIAHSISGADMNAYTNGVVKDTLTTTKTPTPNDNDFNIGNGELGYYGGQLNEIVLAKRYFRPEEIKTAYLHGLNGKEFTTVERPIGNMSQVVWID